MRYVCESRTIPGHIDAERVAIELIDALTRPLTEEEKAGGRWEIPDERIIFEGSLDEAQAFYQQTEKIPNLQNAPISLYTDGLPIIVPTEERVAEMLKGTSHKPDEIITYHEDHSLHDRMIQMGNSGKKSDPVYFMPMRRKATVEKIATIGVMAGCKLEHMPVLLAIAEAGGGCGDGRGGQFYVVSGPYGREIDMNFDVNVFGPGNPANRSIGRAAELMWRNLGDNIPSVTNAGVWGNALNNCFPENAEALPPGWRGLNEEYGFKKEESVVVSFMAMGLNRTQFRPGGYREFQKSGHGGVARRLGVKGTPGPHNWLEYIIPDMWPGYWINEEGGVTIFMLPEMAQHLYEYGFKGKDEVYEWLYNRSFMQLKHFRNYSVPDVNTNAWLGIEPRSGKHWKELPDDALVSFLDDPWQNCIIVSGAGEEQAFWTMGRQLFSNDSAYSIDAWR